MYQKLMVAGQLGLVLDSDLQEQQEDYIIKSTSYTTCSFNCNCMIIAVMYVPEVDGSWTVGVDVGFRSARTARRLIKSTSYNLIPHFVCSSYVCTRS